MYFRQVAFKHENSPAGMTHLCGQLVAPVRERVQIGLDNSPFGCLASRRAEFLSPRQFLLRTTFVMNYMIVDIIRLLACNIGTHFIESISLLLYFRIDLGGGIGVQLVHAQITIQRLEVGIGGEHIIPYCG